MHLALQLSTYCLLIKPHQQTVDRSGKQGERAEESHVTQEPVSWSDESRFQNVGSNDCQNAQRTVGVYSHLWNMVVRGCISDGAVGDLVKI